MPLQHLALRVADIERARRFYAQELGFDAAEPVWHADVLFLRNADGFSLALMPAQQAPRPSGVDHFGFRLPTPEAVRQLRQRFAASGIPILEDVEEPDLVSFKCADPDGYRVEVSWEPS